MSETLKAACALYLEYRKAGQSRTLAILNAALDSDLSPAETMWLRHHTE